MINKDAVKSVLQKADEEKWSYPQLFNALRDIGVERYETNVLTHEMTYVGGGTSFIVPAPDGFEKLQVGIRFDEPAIKTALTRIQKEETTYTEFLSELAAAGVPFYRVDMKPRTVTYHGQNRTQKLVEKVPA